MTKVEIDRICTVYLSVNNQETTAKMLHHSLNTVSRVLKDAGLAKGKGGNPCYKITDRQILEAVNAGFTKAEIATRYGVHPENLSRRMRKLGVRAVKQQTPKARNTRTWAEWTRQNKEQAERRAEERATAKAVYKKEHTVERKCKICGASFYCLDTESKATCSKECSNKLKHSSRDKRIPSDQKVDNILLPRLFNRDRGICYLCGAVCDWDDWRVADSGNKYPGDSYPTIDHVVPISLGGLDSWENVRLACWKCNHEKGASIVNSVSTEPAIRPQPKTGAKKTLQFSKTGELVRVWDSTGQIKRELGLNDRRIQEVCRGEGKTAFGYVWKYAT